MLGKKTECSVCTVTEAAIWCRGEDGSVLCNVCLSSERPVTRHVRKPRSVTPEVQEEDSQASDAKDNREAKDGRERKEPKEKKDWNGVKDKKEAREKKDKDKVSKSCSPEKNRNKSSSRTRSSSSDDGKPVLKMPKLELRKIVDSSGGTSSSDTDSPAKRKVGGKGANKTTQSSSSILPKIDEEPEVVINEFDSGINYSSKKSDGKENKDKKEGDEIRRDTGRKTRKTTKLSKGVLTKGRSRRNIFKKFVNKSQMPKSMPVFVKSVFYQDQYYQLGDIVSVEDEEGGTFYCQIRGLVQDQYCEKSAVVTWLLPTTRAPDPDTCFDPACYVIGPEEEIARKLSHFRFVMNVPSDYYCLKHSPYPTLPATLPRAGYVWTSLRPTLTASRASPAQLQ